MSDDYVFTTCAFIGAWMVGRWVGLLLVRLIDSRPE